MTNDSNDSSSNHNEPTDAQVDAAFRLMMAHVVIEPQAPEPSAAQRALDQCAPITISGTDYRREAESLRLQLQEAEQDRDQLRQANEDLDEQLHQVIAERDAARRQVNQ